MIEGGYQFVNASKVSILTSARRRRRFVAPRPSSPEEPGTAKAFFFARTFKRPRSKNDPTCVEFAWWCGMNRNNLERKSSRITLALGGRARRLLRTVTLLLAFAGGIGLSPRVVLGAPSANMLTTLPTVAQVQQKFQGSDPTETAAMQVVAFHALARAVMAEFSTGGSELRMQAERATDIYQRAEEQTKRAAIDRLIAAAKKGGPDPTKTWNAAFNRYASGGVNDTAARMLDPPATSPTFEEVNQPKPKDTLGRTVGGLILMIGPFLLTGWLWLFHSRRSGPRSVSGAALAAFQPKDSRVRLESFQVGTSRQQYATVAPIYAVNNVVSGGGTRIRYYKLFDFGYSVRNVSQTTMRVQVSISRGSETGSGSTGSLDSWLDLRPGEQRLMWFGLGMASSAEFCGSALLAVCVGEAPQDPRMGAHWSDVVQASMPFGVLFGTARRGLWKALPLSVPKLIVLFVFSVIVVSVVTVLGSRLLSTLF